MSKYAKLNPKIHCLIADQRNHGDSPPREGPHTMFAAAHDMISLCDSLNATPNVIIGHSLGGKIASTMAALLEKQNRAPTQVWIFDSIVDATSLQDPAFQSQSVVQVIQHIKDTPLPIPSSKWLQQHFLDAGFSKDIAAWMTTNIRKVGDKAYTWKFDLVGCEELFIDYLNTSLWEFLLFPPSAVKVNFVIAEKSPRWNQATLQRFDDIAKIQPRTRFHTLTGSGHNVHFENPNGLYKIFNDNFTNQL